MKKTQLKSKSTLKSKSSLKSSSTLKVKKPLKSKKKIGLSKPIAVDMWSLSQADNLFAAYIKERDKYCQACGTAYLLTCSHFNKREIWSTRYDPYNSITFCVPCHEFFERNKEQYTLFMIKKIGPTKVEELQALASLRISKEEAIIKFQKTVINDLAVIQF